MSLANDLNKIDTDLKQVKTDTNSALSEKGSAGVSTLSELPLAIRNIPSGSYTLPVATADTLGGVKVGENLSITPEGVLSATGGGSPELILDYTLTENTLNLTLNKCADGSSFTDKNMTKCCVYIEGKANMNVPSDKYIGIASSINSINYTHTGYFEFPALLSQRNRQAACYIEALGNTAIINGCNITGGRGTKQYWMSDDRIPVKESVFKKITSITFWNSIYEIVAGTRIMIWKVS